jgi:membrane protease YdiL (CAAX protease family)
LTYTQRVHQPINQLAFILPLLILFHAVSHRMGTGLLVPEYLRVAFAWLGGMSPILPPLAIVVVLLCQHLSHHDRWTISPTAVLGITVESIVSCAPLWMVAWLLTTTTAAQQGDPSLGLQLTEAIGAGIYEEFLFRAVLFLCGLTLCVDLLHWPIRWVAPVLIVISSVSFALCHFPIEQWTTNLDMPRLEFLAAAGLYWSALYLWRGFAVAVGAHIAWDVLVVLSI